MIYKQVEEKYILPSNKLVFWEKSYSKISAKSSNNKGTDLIAS